MSPEVGLAAGWPCDQDLCVARLLTALVEFHCWSKSTVMKEKEEEEEEEKNVLGKSETEEVVAVVGSASCLLGLGQEEYRTTGKAPEKKNKQKH